MASNRTGRPFPQDADNMKLLYITSVPARYQLELFDSIIEQGLADVRALFSTWSYPGLWEDRPKLREGFEVLPRLQFQQLYPDLIFNFGIKQRAKSFDPDIAIIGGHHVPGLHQAMSILTRMKIPWLFWEEIVRIPENPWKRAIRLHLLDGVIRRCRSILAVGARAQSFFQERAGGTKRIHNFPYGSDLGRFMSISRTPRTDKKIRFLYCGQLVHRKGVDILIDAFCRVAPRHPQSELVLLGSGILRDSLEKQVPESLRGRIRFEGHVEWENLPKLYSTADVFTFASRYDGWGMVVPEAMAGGLPVITTSAVGSAVHLIQNQENGFLFESENTEQLANHMEFFCQHPQECARMGTQARESARSLDARQASHHLIDILREEMR